MLHNGFRINDYLPTRVLTALYRDPDQPPKKRYAALVALGVKGEASGYDVLTDALKDPNPQLRRYALEALMRHPQANEAEEHVVRLLFDVDDQVRQTALKACARLGFSHAHDGVVQLLEAENPFVRDTALNALQALWREEDFERVFQLYRNDRRRSVRIAAAKLLRQRVSRENWGRLFDAWSDDREARHRLWACELAAEFGGRQEAPAIRGFLDDRNGNVREAAQRSLAALHA